LIGEPKNVDRVIFCSGKVYYDLAAYLETNRVNSAALVRVEQLYPLNLERLEDVVSDFRNASKWIWCQEEPRNMGAWTYIAPLLARVARQDLEYAGRPVAASPAVGSKAWHDQQQKELVHQAFSM
jgi:2-oxoglutarate dehydrogenase E1 component